MHYCNLCDYYTLESDKIKSHYKTKKHINNFNAIHNNVVDVNLNTQLICNICKKEFLLDQKCLSIYKFHNSNNTVYYL